jgi:hypothetical protein
MLTHIDTYIPLVVLEYDYYRPIKMDNRFEKLLRRRSELFPRLDSTLILGLAQYSLVLATTIYSWHLYNAKYFQFRP